MSGDGYNGENRRAKPKMFGVSLSIPVTWLVSLLVIGLVQFGVFWQKFDHALDNQEKQTEALSVLVDAVHYIKRHDGVQDERIETLKQKTESLERQMRRVPEGRP